MTLYHVPWCPECLLVQRTLDEHGLAYDSVVVPDRRSAREAVYNVSGQYYVPVLVDNDTVLTETGEILAHLEGRREDSTSS